MFRPYADILAGRLAYAGSAAEFLPDPVAVGAVGGSGTRVIAQLLSRAGIIMATPMNVSQDALEWPPLEQILAPEMLKRFPRASLLANAFNGLERLLLLRQAKLGLCGRGGWKVPGTHLWLEELADYFPQMQYVHLIRHGLDMAFSPNTQQARRWGHRVNPDLAMDPTREPSPGQALEYWLAANERALEIGRRRLGARFLLLRYEQLVARPREQLARLLAFLHLEAEESQLEDMAAMIRRPASVDRFRNQSWQTQVSREQLQRLQALGYTP
jgi:hypothetical protein